MDSNKIKKGLGRGLSSLIGETKTISQNNKLSITEIVPNKFQPRKNFDENNYLDYIVDHKFARKRALDCYKLYLS